MRVVIEKGLGGFVSLCFDHVHKNVTHPVVIRFGVSRISIYINGDLRTAKPMSKPQKDYTLEEIEAFYTEAVRLVEML